MTSFPEWLGLDEATSAAEAINETLACAAEQLDIVIAILAPDALHVEVEVYLDAMSIARAACAVCDDAGCEFCPAVPRCRNCGHATAWPVSFCYRCPKEDLE